MLYIRLLVMLAILSATCVSCKRKSMHEEELRIISEWTGREILFPDSMMLVDGNLPEIGNADFTIVSYYDSVGCTGCRMKLAYWNEFMRKVDSIPVRVNLILIATSRDRANLRSLVKSYAFRHVLLWDPENKFGLLNSLPDGLKFQTYLLDRYNRILTIGNPLSGRKMEKLYLATIGVGNGDIDEYNGDDADYGYDFGSIAKRETVDHTFRLRNDTGKPMKVRDVITSCECTTAEISETEIAAEAEYEVTVTFNDTITGRFYRTVTLLFENGAADVTIELTGEITN